MLSITRSCNRHSLLQLSIKVDNLDSSVLLCSLDNLHFVIIIIIVVSVASRWWASRTFDRMEGMQVALSICLSEPSLHELFVVLMYTSAYVSSSRKTSVPPAVESHHPFGGEALAIPPSIDVRDLSLLELFR